MADGWKYFIEHAGTRHPLETRQLTVGRSRKCDISVPDPSVSRKHVYLTAGGGQVMLQDLGSSNGTFLNGERIQGTCVLIHGNTLELGDAVLNVVIETAGVPAAGVPAAGVPAAGAEAPPAMGEATSFLQAASVRLAQEAIVQDDPADVGPPAAPAAPWAAPAAPAPAAAPAAAPGSHVTTRLDPSQLGSLGDAAPPLAEANATARLDPSQLAAIRQEAQSPSAADVGMATTRIDPSQLDLQHGGDPQGGDPVGMATARLDPSQLNLPEGAGMATARLDPSQLNAALAPNQDAGMATTRLDPSQLAELRDPGAAEAVPSAEPAASAAPDVGMATTRLDPSQLAGLDIAGAPASAESAPPSDAPPPAAPAFEPPAVGVAASTTRPGAATGSFKGLMDESLGGYKPPSESSPPAFDPPAFEAPTFEAPSFDAAVSETPETPAPSFDAPPDPAPSFDPPTFEAPTFEAPSFDAAASAAPEPSTPSFDEPSFDAPSEPAPSFEAPSFEAPSFDAPTFDAPSTETPSLDTPSLDTPALDTPALDTPELESPGFGSPASEAAAPSFDAPVESAPAVQPPAFDPPAFDPPAFEAPNFDATPDESLAPPEVPAVPVGAPSLDTPAPPPSTPPPPSAPQSSTPAASPPPVAGVSSPPLEFPDLSSTDPGLTDIRNLGLPSLDDDTGTGSELLPSLDGFDTTLGPGVEMPKALEQAHQNMAARHEAEATEEVSLPTAQYNPYQPTAGAEPPRAGFWIRALAVILDGLWMGGLSAAAVLFSGSQLVAASVSGFNLLVVLVCWSLWGQTPGKRLVGIYVCTKEGKPGIGFLLALVRLAGYMVSSLLFFVGFLLALGEEKRALHDRIAGTYVRRRR